jgi:hypothetical protein
MPKDRKEGVAEVTSAEALVRSRVSVDQIRLSRLATQNAIERSRDSLAEARAALVALRDLHASELRQKVQKRIYALKPRKGTH